MEDEGQSYWGFMFLVLILFVRCCYTFKHRYPPNWREVSETTVTPQYRIASVSERIHQTDNTNSTAISMEPPSYGHILQDSSKIKNSTNSLTSSMELPSYEQVMKFMK